MNMCGNVFILHGSKLCIKFKSNYSCKENRTAINFGVLSCESNCVVIKEFHSWRPVSAKNSVSVLPECCKIMLFLGLGCLLVLCFSTQVF